MPAHDDPPQTDSESLASAHDAVDNRRPKPQVTHRSSQPLAGDTSQAPLGFEALLREINTVVELLERIDSALDAHSAPNDLAA